MLFEWDEDKRRRNLRKHGINFIDAQKIWSGTVLEYASDQTHHDEERYLAIGKFDGSGDSRRSISARKARRYEQKDYQNETG